MSGGNIFALHSSHRKKLPVLFLKENSVVDPSKHIPIPW
jgi:hypothetical protein